jgi:sec-independent protein translocase protein TatA
MDGLILAGQVGGWQIIIIVLVILLLFGGKKIPELMRGLGQGIAEFKKGMREGDVDQPKKDSAEKREQ